MRKSQPFGTEVLNETVESKLNVNVLRVAYFVVYARSTQYEIRNTRSDAASKTHSNQKMDTGAS